MSQISPHISLAEATFTNTGLKNDPTPEALVAMKLVATKVFEPLRKHMGGPIGINSFYRSPAVNKAIGGAPASQHVRGEAMDISGTKYGISNAEIFEFILVKLKFDQLIWEFGTDEEPQWVHVSYKSKGNRSEVLKAYKLNGVTKYKRL